MAVGGCRVVEVEDWDRGPKAELQSRDVDWSCRVKPRLVHRVVVLDWHCKIRVDRAWRSSGEKKKRRKEKTRKGKNEATRLLRCDWSSEGTTPRDWVGLDGGL